MNACRLSMTWACSLKGLLDGDMYPPVTVCQLATRESEIE